VHLSTPCPQLPPFDGSLESATVFFYFTALLENNIPFSIAPFAVATNGFQDFLGT